jgi:hypothetical protein
VDCEGFTLTGLELLSRATGWTIWGSILIWGNSFLSKNSRPDSLLPYLQYEETRLTGLVKSGLATAFKMTSLKERKVEVTGRRVKKTSAVTGSPQGKEKIL